MQDMIDITLLKPHSQNTEIYGDEDIKELANKIKESNWINPLVINENNVIISGHRRLKASVRLGLTELPFTRVKFENENDELERLLLENEYREKTTYQKMQEGKMWETIYKVKAKEKMSLGGKGKENSPTLVKGQTRDLVAEKVGVGSGKTYETAKKVIKKIEKSKEEGNEKNAEFLTVVLNESVSGAENLLKADLNKIDEKLKDKVINKEITAKEAVKEIKKAYEQESKGKEKFPTLEAKPTIEVTSTKEEMKVCTKCGEEKSIHNFYEGKNQCIKCCNSVKNPKNVYGNEIKINKEKLKGIDIEALIANAKDTNKNINDTDDESVVMELTCNVDMFVQNLSKYIDMEERFENMENENKNRIMESITSIEEVMNKIKGFLY